LRGGILGNASGGGCCLENQARFFPAFYAGSEEDEPETIQLRKGGLVDLALVDDQLLPKQGILGDEVGSTARQVGGTEINRIARKLDEMKLDLFKGRNQTDKQLGWPMKEGERRV
jgi:hypothetical protein